MSLKPVIIKELWQYRSNKNLIVLSTNALFIIAIGLLLILSGPQYLTPYSKQVAMRQISENPSIFGLSIEDVAKMGDQAIVFASLVSQLPLVIIVTSTLSSYMSIVTSLFYERLYKTMEVLLSSPCPSLKSSLESCFPVCSLVCSRGVLISWRFSPFCSTCI